MLNNFLQNLTDEQKKQLLLGVSIVTLLVLIMAIGFSNARSNTSPKQVRDAYGDVVEQNISGQPLEEVTDGFIIKFNDFLNTNISPDQLSTLKKSLRFYIWDTINPNETKAVFTEGMITDKDSTSIYTVKVRTVDNTTEFTVDLVLDRQLTITSATATYNSEKTPLSVSPRKSNLD